jgi:hypothetical protein
MATGVTSTLWLVFACQCMLVDPLPQDPEVPDQFIDLLKPGMIVSLDTINQDVDSFALNVWTSRRFAMEVDARTLTFPELAEKYPSIGVAAEKIILHASAHKIPNANFEYEFVPIWTDRYEPLTVAHVGRDYVVFESAVNAETRTAYRSTRFTELHWGFNNIDQCINPKAEFVPNE